jgi:hypothetical protein
VAISVVWWGLFWGGFGTWLGALAGMLAERGDLRPHDQPEPASSTAVDDEEAPF